MTALLLALQVITAPATTPAAPPGQTLPTDPPKTTATIRGHVSASDTSQPLRKAQVRIVQIEAAPGTTLTARENRLASTDANGAYEFTDLPAGRYNLTASKGSYVQLAWGQEQPNAPGKPLVVAAGETLERVDFTLPRGAVLTGRIVDEFGEPLTGVQVATVRSVVVNGTRRMTPTGRTSSTDDLGEFRIFGVPPGQYYVQATWRRPGGIANPNAPASDRTGYPVTYFPGTTELANAQRFTIGVG